MIRNSTTRVSLEKLISAPNQWTVPTPMQKAFATPIRMAARKAPPMLPRPPTTVTTKASAMTERSSSRLAGSRGICSAPPRPASTEPTKNTEVKSLAWSTPSAPTISRSWVAARTSAPQRVRVSSSHMASSTTGPMAISSRS